MATSYGPTNTRNLKSHVISIDRWFFTVETEDSAVLPPCFRTKGADLQVGDEILITYVTSPSSGLYYWHRDLVVGDHLPADAVCQ